MNKKNILGFIVNFNAIVMAAVFLVVILPIPAILLDILIALNILLSLYLLFITSTAKKMEDISLLPTLILVINLLNLATTVAVTRVILTHGQEFGGIFVRFIASLASFGGMSGVISSLSIFIVLFCASVVIITKGSTRVAEVAARFTLDSMPFKLMAIENELQSNAITEEEAAKRKNAVSSECDFYGTLDGVCKFINGNVKLTIIIIFVTIAAGILIGTRIRNEELNEALITYISLAIGSGVFAIIPPFILSTAMGIAIKKLVKGEGWANWTM